MLYRIRFRLIMIFLNLSLANAAQGQWIPQGINYYDPSDETLHLPNVYVIPGPGSTTPPQIMYNSVLQQRGDNKFELTSTEELQPEQECTRAEVLNVIPQMHLDISVDEINALVGCNAVIRRGQADLETGLLVNASWAGRDGVPHGGSNTGGFQNVSGSNSFIGTGVLPNRVPVAVNPFRPTNGYVLSTNPSLSLTLTSVNFGSSGFSASGAPYITLALRENVVESYSYSPAGHTDRMPRLACGELQAGFNQLSMGDTFETVSNTLGCDAFLNRVTVSSEADQRDYQWHYLFQQYVPPGSSNPGGVSINNWQTQTVSVSFLNDAVQLFNMRSSESIVSAQECTVDGILEAAQRIQVGDVVNDMSTLLDCGTRNESFVSDGGGTRTTSQWRTQILGTSPFTAANRSLLVSITGNKVTGVHVQRY